MTRGNSLRSKGHTVCVAALRKEQTNVSSRQKDGGRSCWRSCMFPQNVKTVTPSRANRDPRTAHSHPVPEQLAPKRETRVCTKKQKCILKVNIGYIVIERLHV